MSGSSSPSVATLTLPSLTLEPRVSVAFLSIKDNNPIGSGQTSIGDGVRVLSGTQGETFSQAVAQLTPRVPWVPHSLLPRSYRAGQS